MTTIGWLRPLLFRCLSFLSVALLCLRWIHVFFFFSFISRTTTGGIMIHFCLAASLCISLRARVRARVGVRTSCHHTVSKSPGAGCFTGTIWQEQRRPGDSARVTASPPRSTFPLKDEPRHLDGGFYTGNRHSRAEVMKTGELSRANHFLGVHLH